MSDISLRIAVKGKRTSQFPATINRLHRNSHRMPSQSGYIGRAQESIELIKWTSQMRPEKKALWLLAQIKPNSTSIAKRNLERQGFRCFLPLDRRTRRLRGQLTPVKTPFFPGYLFVGIEADDTPWRAIRSTYGVAKLVSFGLEPATVPEELIGELMSRCDNEGCIRNHVAVAERDRVEISHGPLANFFGIVEKLAANERAWVLIDMMGQSIRSSMPRSDLRVVI
ncbi:transcription termination/antitermination protein NusG [Qipengyuania sp.]|uniref:transcription termination/antitermination protein NusG n=1 Tax=Qipengyuania sp. TaxID=2004515 RepID=UPI003BACB457